MLHPDSALRPEDEGGSCRGLFVADFIVAIFSNQKKHRVEDFAWTGLGDSVALEHALSRPPSPPTLSLSLARAHALARALECTSYYC